MKKEKKLYVFFDYASRISTCSRKRDGWPHRNFYEPMHDWKILSGVISLYKERKAARNERT